MLNANWTLWIQRAIKKHFDFAPIKTWIEEEDINTEGETEWVEVRTNGPHYHELSKDVHEIKVEVNCMISRKLVDDKRYRIHELTGLVQAKGIPICIIDNDDLPIGYLILRDDVPRPIDTVVWGITEATTKQFQASVDFYYRMNVT